MAGWAFAVALGLVFTAGMMVADGVNGLWIGRLLQRADTRAVAISRAMSFSIGGLSITIAALGIVKYFSPVAASMVEDAGLLIGISLAICLPAIFAVVLCRASKTVSGQVS